MARRSNGGRSNGSWLALFSFIAVMLLGLALAISLVLGKWVNGAESVAAWIQRIAIAIALVVPLIYSYYEARRHGTVWFVLWVIAVILIVVFYILLAVL